MLGGFEHISSVAINCALWEDSPAVFVFFVGVFGADMVNFGDQQLGLSSCAVSIRRQVWNVLIWTVRHVYEQVIRLDSTQLMSL